MFLIEPELSSSIGDILENAFNDSHESVDRSLMIIGSTTSEDNVTEIAQQASFLIHFFCASTIL